MFRQIITPSDTQLLLQLPAEFVGKQVEVIAFTVNEKSDFQNQSKELRKKELRKKLKNYCVDMRNFKFNRDEANNYE